METTVELDKLGRFVVPKQIRNALNVRPGDRLKVSVTGDVLTIEPLHKPCGLSLYKGRHVVDGGPFQDTDIVAFLRPGREQRMFHVLGMHEEQ